MAVTTETPGAIAAPTGVGGAGGAVRRIGREELAALGRSGRAWEFVPMALQALRGAPEDFELRFLLAANYARLLLATAAKEQLAVLPETARAEPGVAALAALLDGLPGDEVSVEDRVRTCGRNVEVLRGRGIDLTGEFGRWQDLTRAERWFRARDGNIVRRAAEWLRFRDDMGEAGGLKLPDAGPMGAGGAKPVEPVTLEGFDPPWMFLRLYEQVAPRGDGYFPSIRVLQGDALEFLDGLACADMSGPLADERVRFFIGTDAAERFGEHLDERMDTVFHGPVVSLGTQKRPPAPGAVSVMGARAARQRALDAPLLGRIGALYAGRDRAWWTRRYASAEQLRVLIPTCRYSTFIQHSAADLARAFERAGWGARVLIEPDRHSHLAPTAYLRAVAEFVPDLVVLINHTRTSIGSVFPAELPLVCWLQDAMPHQFRQEHGRAQGEMDFLVGHLHEELFTQFGYPRGRTLAMPVVASEHKFHPSPVAPALRRRFECEVALVSHHSETPEQMHARLLGEVHDGAIGAVFNDLRPRVTEIGRDPMSGSASTRLREAVRESAGRLLGCGHDSTTATLIFRQYAQPLADRVLRHQTVEWAAEVAERRGWRLHLYGRGWESHPRLGRYARGIVAHDEDLRACYQCAGAHLHASINGMIHQRVLECALSGGLVLCRTLFDALGVGQWRAKAAVRRESLPEFRDPESGWLRFAVADHLATMQLAALWQRLGLDHGPHFWIEPTDPGADPAGAPDFLKCMIREYDAAWMLGDLAAVGFQSPEELENALGRAIETPRWRTGMSGLISGRARGCLTYDALTRRILTMIKASLAADPVSVPERPAAEAWTAVDDAAGRLERLTASPETHRAVRAHFGRTADADAVRRVADRYDPPAWTQGKIGLGDALFLYDLVRCIEPARIIELGTASGASSALLLLALHDLGRPLRDECNEARLHSFDISPWCYFDKDRPVGSAVMEMTPELRHGLKLHPFERAPDAARLFAPNPVPFAFLDANHCHPWPIADVLALQPALAPGAWVAVHDIELPRMARGYEEATGQKVDWHQKGVQVLFEHWPFEKIRGVGEAFNIGAIRMPEKRILTAEDFRGALDIPWESAPSDDLAAQLGRPWDGAHRPSPSGDRSMEHPR